MNILDEETKAMLDAGSTAVLNGKYLAMTPETLRQAVETNLIITIEDTTSGRVAPEEANSSFIQQGCKCHFCGKASHWGTEYIVTIEGGYNSDHDMETVSVDVCAGCLEKMLAAVN